MRLLVAFIGLCVLLAGTSAFLLFGAFEPIKFQPDRPTAPSERPTPTSPAAQDISELDDSRDTVGANDESQSTEISTTEQPSAKPSPVRWADADATRRKSSNALAAADAALAHDPDSEPALRAKLHALAELGRQPEMRPVLDDLLRSNPDDADLWFESASLHLSARQWVEAADALQHVLTLRPDDRRAMFNLSTAYRALNRLGDAERMLDPLCDGTTSNPEAFARRAEVRFLLEHWSAAAADWRVALDARPDDADIALNLSLAHERLGEREAAADVLRKFLLGHENVVPVINRLALLRLADARDAPEQSERARNEAMALMRRSLELIPQQPDLRALLIEPSH